MPSHATLIDLPEPILRQIALSLAPPDAIDIARTHSTLVSAAQSSIWSELNISLQRSFLPNPQPHDWTRPLGGNKLYHIRQLQTWEHPLKYTHALEAYFTSLESHLTASDIRCKAVRAIYIDIDRLLHLRFANVLKLVSPTLRRLEFIALDFPRGVPVAPHPSFPSIRQLFESSLQIRLERLTHLSLPLDTTWDATLLAVLRRTPNLISLVLTPEQGWSGGWGEKVVYRPAEVNSWPVLPRLKRLEVEEFQKAFYPFLESLVLSAPDLASVSLQDPCRVMRTSEATSLLDALAQCSQLQYFACPGIALSPMENCKFPTSLTEISTMENIRLWEIPFLEAVTIPPIPHMKLFHSHARISEDSMIWTWHHDSCPLPAALLPVSRDCLRSIHTAEDLIMIQSSTSSRTELPLPISAEAWSAYQVHYGRETTRAVLIRTYHPSNHQMGDVSSQGEHNEDQEIFTHCRSFCAEQCHIEEGQLQRSQAVWTEHVDYSGHQIPGDILAEVYGVLGESAGWQIPGRGLELPDTAWQLLRTWKRQQSENF